MVTKKQLKNLKPAKAGDQRALKGSKPMLMTISARIEPDNEKLLLALIKKHGTKAKAINYLIANS